MEIHGTDGSKLHIKPNKTTQFGRKNGLTTTDIAVSRHHLSFTLISTPNSSQTAPKVAFEVTGKNPVWVCDKDGGEKIRPLRRFEKGELGIGDSFCVSAKDPVWFTLKEVGSERMDIDEGLSQSLEDGGGDDDFGLDFVDVSDVDPVQEFGFLVIGHEFDKYPKKMILDIKDWDWFLDDSRGDSDDEEAAEKKGKAGGRRKRKKTKGDDGVDEEWTGESEDEELTTKARKVQRPKYQTRSKDHSIPSNSRTNKKTSATTSSREEEEDYEDEEDVDEDDETLGGFIVDDDTAEDDDEEGNEIIDQDEEEEFVEDDDELEE